MALQKLFTILTFDLASGNSVTIPHGLHFEGMSVAPLYAQPNSVTAVIVVGTPTATDITFTNTGALDETAVEYFVWLEHTHLGVDNSAGFFYQGLGPNAGGGGGSLQTAYDGGNTILTAGAPVAITTPGPAVAFTVGTNAAFSGFVSFNQGFGGQIIKSDAAGLDSSAVIIGTITADAVTHLATITNGDRVRVYFAKSGNTIWQPDDATGIITLQDSPSLILRRYSFHAAANHYRDFLVNWENISTTTNRLVMRWEGEDGGTQVARYWFNGDTDSYIQQPIAAGNPEIGIMSQSGNPAVQGSGNAIALNNTYCYMSFGAFTNYIQVDGAGITLSAAGTFVNVRGDLHPFADNVFTNGVTNAWASTNTYNVLFTDQGADPAAPAAGHIVMYTKAQALFARTADGTVHAITAVPVF